MAERPVGIRPATGDAMVVRGNSWFGRQDGFRLGLSLGEPRLSRGDDLAHRLVLEVR